MDDIVIEVKKITKKYTISTGYEPDTLRDKLVEFINYPIRALKGTHKTKTKTFWALRDVSFNVKRGEILGIIGRNGAGKSTMLKILARITEPTSGEITLSGRVASLLEVGTGFNPELTGRENIYLNGAILGMKKAEISQKFQEIVDFSGIGEFIDTPVKRYSSGMYVRLAFAVAAHLDSDILLIDEVLSVGDFDFQKKSLAKIHSLTTAQNKTVIFVSHSMDSIAKLCSRIVYLKSGRVKTTTSSVKKVIDEYSGGSKVKKYPGVWISTKRRANKWFTVQRVHLTNQRNVTTSIFTRDENIGLHITGNLTELNPLLQIGYALYDVSTEQLLYWQSFTDLPKSKWPKISMGRIEFKTQIPAGLLNERTYRIEVMGALNNVEWFYQPESNSPAIVFEIKGGLPADSLWRPYKRGLIAPLQEWQAVSKNKEILINET